jgi:hypothetical protein
MRGPVLLGLDARPPARDAPERLVLEGPTERALTLASEDLDVEVVRV